MTMNDGRPILVMIVPWRIPIPAQASSAAGSRPPRPAVSRAREVGHDHAAEAGHEPDREVDLAEQQDEDLAHREQAEHRGLDEQVDEVAGGQELRVEGLEEDRDQDQPRDDRQDPALAGLDPGERRPEVFADGIRGDLGRNGELGPASRLLRLDVRLGRPTVSSTLAIRRRLRSCASRSDWPVVIRSTTICRSNPLLGPNATSRPRCSTATRSATSNTSFKLCEIMRTAQPFHDRRARAHEVEDHARLVDAERGRGFVHDHEARVPQHRLRGSRPIAAVHPRGNRPADGSTAPSSPRG